VRVGWGIKTHWRRESKYADIAAVWRLASVLSECYSVKAANGGIFARCVQLKDEISDDDDARVSGTCRTAACELHK
jgi:hypothetical protein